MKAVTVYLLPIFISLSVSFNSHAQFADRLKKAAERGVSRAIEKKLETEMEKLAMRQLNKVFKDVYGTEDPSSLPGVDMDKIMKSIGSDVEVDESYDFSGFATLEITGVDEKGKPIEPVLFKSYFSENPNITGMEFSENNKKQEDLYVMILDFNRNLSISLFENEGQKMRMAFEYNYAQMSAAVPTEDMEEPINETDVSFKKTGNSKTILGFDCDEYLIETEENQTNYWVTQKPINGQASFWAKNNPFLTSKMEENNPGLFENLPTGNMLEAYIVSKKDKSVMEMKVLEINENEARSFIMAEYPGMVNIIK